MIIVHDLAMLAILSPGVKNILLAGIFFAFINALVKYLGHVPVAQVLFFRSIVSLLISGYFVHKNRLKVFDSKNFKFLMLRGLCGALALAAYFTTIQKIPLASAVTILYLAPIFTVIFAIFINQEFPSKYQWPFMFISLLGAMWLKDSDYRIEIHYFFLGLLAAVFAGLAYNFIRKLKDSAHPQLVIFYFPLVTLPIVTPFMLKNWYTPNLVEFGLLIGIGVLTQIAQVFMTKAYMLEAASKISHFNYLTSVYAWLSGILFFHEQIPLQSILALLMIIVGVYFCSKFAPKS